MTYQHSTRLTDYFFARQKNVSALQTWNKDDEKKIRKNITCFWDHTCIRNNWRTLSVISLCGMIAQHKRLPENKLQKKKKQSLNVTTERSGTSFFFFPSDAVQRSHFFMFTTRGLGILTDVCLRQASPSLKRPHNEDYFFFPSTSLITFCRSTRYSGWNYSHGHGSGLRRWQGDRLPRI